MRFPSSGIHYRRCFVTISGMYFFLRYLRSFIFPAHMRDRLSSSWIHLIVPLTFGLNIPFYEAPHLPPVVCFRGHLYSMLEPLHQWHSLPTSPYSMPTDPRHVPHLTITLFCYTTFDEYPNCSASSHTPIPAFVLQPWRSQDPMQFSTHKSHATNLRLILNR